MYIGLNMLKEILDDSPYTNWLYITAIGSENSCSIEFSNRKTLTVHETYENLLDIIVKAETKFLLPSIAEFCSADEALALNKQQIFKVTDENITFKDSTVYANPYCNERILIEVYKLYE